jgi:hypothetical protein
MRTTDFSHAPAMGQANALFAGGTCFTSPWSFIGLYRRWVPMVRRMKKMPGYRGHYVWYRFPSTLGTIAFFADRTALLKFARTKEHGELMRWVMEPRHARGGFIRLHAALPSGYSSGIWRAEGNVMQAIEEYTPLPGEEHGPPVPQPKSQSKSQSKKRSRVPAR